jgi:hypothetical protein
MSLFQLICDLAKPAAEGITPGSAAVIAGPWRDKHADASLRNPEELQNGIGLAICSEERAAIRQSTIQLALHFLQSFS